MIMFRSQTLRSLGIRFMPFSDAASDQLPLGQLLRLSLFQLSVGMATVLLLGTLNRVMIVELSLPAMLVAIMIALPVLIAPFRALLGFRSDNYRSALGWKRIPYLWFGSLWQMGGLAVMPFALLVLGDNPVKDVPFAGEVLAALAFLMTGLGIHMTQTAGLALASDRATEETRPRVVALLYVMFLAGMGISALLIGWLLRDFEPFRLVRVVQGAAIAGLALNLFALWKQERLNPMSRQERAATRPRFTDAWRDFVDGGKAARLLATVFLGTMAFNMQDVLLEPYGGEVLGMSVSSTTLLTAIWAVGALAGFALAASRLANGTCHFRLAASGLLTGLAAFCCVILSAPFNSPSLFFAGAALIGLGGGLFAVATLSAAMALPEKKLSGHGLALGAWGAAQATAIGLSIALGGIIRDGVTGLAETGLFGEVMASPVTGYAAVYHVEIALIFVTLAALGPLVQQAAAHRRRPASRDIGLADFPT